MPGRDRAVTIRTAISVGGIFDPIADRIDVFAQLADFHVQHGNIFLKEAQTFVQAINPVPRAAMPAFEKTARARPVPMMVSMMPAMPTTVTTPPHPMPGQYGDWARVTDSKAAAAITVEPRTGGIDAGGSAAQTSSVLSRQASSACRS